jgi:hypothetical protein
MAIEVENPVSFQACEDTIFFGADRQKYKPPRDTFELTSVTGPAYVALNTHFLWLHSAVKYLPRPAQSPIGKMELESIGGKYAQGEELTVPTRGIELTY